VSFYLYVFREVISPTTNPIYDAHDVVKQNFPIQLPAGAWLHWDPSRTESSSLIRNSHD
jgi:hypothetical protein